MSLENSLYYPPSLVSSSSEFPLLVSSGHLNDIFLRLGGMKDSIGKLNEAIVLSRGETFSLLGEIDSLKKEVISLKGEVSSLREENSHIRQSSENISPSKRRKRPKAEVLKDENLQRWVNPRPGFVAPPKKRRVCEEKSDDSSEELKKLEKIVVSEEERNIFTRLIYFVFLDKSLSIYISSVDINLYHLHDSHKYAAHEWVLAEARTANAGNTESVRERNYFILFLLLLLFLLKFFFSFFLFS